MYGDPGADDYYYVDEQGNLIEPTAPGDPRGVPLPPESEFPPGDPRRPDPRAPVPAPPQPRGNVPPAASDDFLDRATGEGAAEEF
jgi:penicillin-binding protein 1A